MKPTYRKSSDGNLLMWLDLTWDPSLGSNEETNLKGYNLFIIGPRSLQCEINL